jgi:hypothetical protein
LCTGRKDGLEVGGVIERRRNHLIPWAYSGEQKRKVKRRVPGADRDNIAAFVIDE